ncbi:MAG: InlB B-repeat-containing protein [Treponema sp.]|jgi:uncharacterized repeat protein (TIGR02543 family)|nr:InlB B-repeat-containing protein [Treponema sp.]
MKNRKISSVLFLIVIAFGLFAACGEPDATPQKYTVSFNANGGSPVPQQQTVAQGGKVTQPPAMSRSGYRFGGWYSDAACTHQWNFAADTVSGNITLYAR